MNNTKKAKSKRLLCLVLTLAMVFGMLPAMSRTVQAYTGSGTQYDPYIVTDYEELRSLMMNASMLGDIRYIKLGADVSYDYNVVGHELLCRNGQRVDLDLNGHSISRIGVSTDNIFEVSGTLTIRDSVGGGKVTSNLAGGNGRVLYGAGGDIIVEGGTFQSNYGFVAGITGNLTVNDGTFISEAGTTFFIYGGSLTMNGGEVINRKYNESHSIYVNTDVNVRLCALTANKAISFYSSGNFMDHIPWSSKLTQGTIDGRHILPDEDTGMIEIVKDYYTLEESGTEEDPYIVTSADILWRMFRCAPKDDIDTTIYIKLGADILMDYSTLMIGNERTKINLDLNGYEIRFVASSYLKVACGSLTINDSAGGGRLIRNTSGYSALISIGGDGQLTINGGSYYVHCSDGTNDSEYVISGGGNASLIINDGAFYGYAQPKLDLWGNPNLNAWGIINFHSDEDEEMTVVINGGQFYNNGDTGTDGHVIVYNKRVNMTLAGLMVEGKIVKKNATEEAGILSDIPATSTLALCGENIREGNNDFLKVDNSTGWIKIISNTAISSVNITGVTAPVVGETVDFSATVNTNGAVKSGVDWYDWTAHRTLSAGEKFQAGHSYMVMVTLTAPDGYIFNTTNSTLDIRINGKEGFLWLANSKRVQCCYCFDEVFPEPVITTQPVASLTIEEGKGFTLHVEADYATDYQWYWRTSNGQNEYKLEKQIVYYEEGTQKTNTLVMNYFDYFNSGGSFYCRVYGPGGYTDTNPAVINVTPVNYDLWVNGEQVTSANKKNLAYYNGSYRARYLPYKNEVTLWDGALINYSGGARVDFSDGGYLDNNNSGILYYTPAGKTAKELIIKVDGSATISGTIGIRAQKSATADGTAGVRVIGWDRKDEDILTMNCSYPFRDAEAVTIEKCTANINGDITVKSTMEVKDADLSISGNIPLSLTSEHTQTLSVYGNSTLTLQGTTQAAKFYESNPANQLLYPVGSTVYVGASKDGSDAVSWSGVELPVWSDYKYIKVATNDSRVPFQRAQVKLSSKPAAGGDLPYVAIDSTMNKYMDEDSVTYTWYLKNNLSTPLDPVTYTCKAGTSYRIYVDVDTNEDNCFPEGVFTQLDITGGGLKYGTISENTGSHLRFYVDFNIAGDATGVTVSGSATSFNSTTDPVTIQLIRSGASEAAYETMVFGNTVNYLIDGVEAGTYTMKIMKNNHVTREYTVTVGSSNVVQNVKICLLGDVTGDGKVNTKDWARLKAHVNETSNLTGYELACGDVNGDGKVNIKDWARLKAHVNESNPLW